jgi:hypothetical protein
MLDIVEANDGEDLTVMDTIVAKAGNLLSVQIGSLEYEQEFGVDFRFFLESEFQFQTESFKTYLVQRLVENQINVVQVMELIETFSHRFTYSVGDVKNSNGGLIV